MREADQSLKNAAAEKIEIHPMPKLLSKSSDKHVLGQGHYVNVDLAFERLVRRLIEHSPEVAKEATPLNGQTPKPLG